MGEVVEITTICEKNTAIKLLNFISNFYNVKYNILKINTMDDLEYKNLVCVDFFKDNDDIHALGIGKELCINYDNGIINGIINSHNVDLWIVSKNYKFKSIQKNIVFI